MLKNSEKIKNMTIDEKLSLLSGKNFWETQELPKHGVPGIFLADGPHGIRRQEKSADHLGLNESVKATCFPTAATLANSFDTALLREVGKAIGEEALHQNVNVLLGPGVNIKRNPLGGRNFEYFSEDPYLAGQLASSMIRGIQSNGVASTVKHFAANNQETNRMVVDTLVDERTVNELYLLPFEMAVKDAKTKVVMSAYNKINGEYANENTYLMQDVLRKSWGFDGVVVTDWGGSNSRLDGLKAGNELEMPGNHGETNHELKKAYEANALDEKTIDESVDRLIDLIDFTTSKTKDDKSSKIDFKHHHTLARKAAEESIVLLKNTDEILPITNDKKVSLIGELGDAMRIQGAGSSQVNPTVEESLLTKMKETDALNFIGFERGYKRFKNRSSKCLTRKAKRLAEKSDVVLVVLGLDETREAEGLDRKTMALPDNQIKLIEDLKKVNENIVVVLTVGSPVTLEFEANVKGLLHTYLSGQAGASALINILSGKVNPSGKLAETYPLSYDAVPSSKYFPGKNKTVEYREGLYVGYKYYDKVSLPVHYPFGHGLSYTTFEYANIACTVEGVSFDITNSGTLGGFDIPQVYLSRSDEKAFATYKALMGFKKLWIEPGKTIKVTIPFDAYAFRFFNPKTRQFEKLNGTYLVQVGQSSRNLPLETNLEVTDYKDLDFPKNHESEAYLKGHVNEETDASFEKRMAPFEANLSKATPTKKKRIKVDYLTTVEDLRYAKGLFAKLFSFGVRFAHATLRLIGKKSTANTLMMGVYYQPMRSISRMSGGMISMGQLDGLIQVFNGHVFKGLKTFRHEKKLKKKRMKDNK